MDDDIRRDVDRPTDPKGGSLRLALVWRGNPEAPDQPIRHRARLQPLTDALTTAGVEVEPVIYLDEAAEAVRARLLQCDGAMVWVDPLDDGRSEEHTSE